MNTMSAKPPAIAKKPRNVSTRGRLDDGSANPIDVHVGARMRLRRTLLGLSQEKLGEALGLTFQQVQKYERGANRIGASRLFDIGRVLDVPISYFFDDMSGATQSQSPVNIIRGTAPVTEMPASAGIDLDPLAKRETLELVRAYYGIRDPKARHKAYELIKAMAGIE